MGKCVNILWSVATFWEKASPLPDPLWGVPSYSLLFKESPIVNEEREDAKKSATFWGGFQDQGWHPTKLSQQAHLQSYAHPQSGSNTVYLLTFDLHTSFGFFYWLLLFSTEWLIIFCSLTSFVSEFKILRWWFSTAVKVLYLVITKEKCGEISEEGSYQELIKTQGEFQEFLLQQLPNENGQYGQNSCSSISFQQK